ncbi:helicase-exonuclease AddAB subunit AddA [Caryophanon tenue]|uniref:ATP-dependent helicase/nuclease subunit A n=1 Tax=Caryophanon tenue TaxID=33978 RepID=A0A1C0YJU2_9BACL|nr:helicase-exonuclease AddAB subunit AddA [Caryophanon tenue]OCS87452.1 helicase-exonuclease AddAB subunit AddA [Caryophanon tenue]
MTNIPKKPADVQWTDEQWQAIYASGQDTLVSAAAGSGKTAVLINRMIEKVIGKTGEPIDCDELLVVTFTNAAAAEMRQRMATALEKELQKQLDNPPIAKHLRRQLTLVNKAQISTLHSFCLAIIKQYAYMLDLDPGFRIANDGEAALLRDDVLAEVLEQAYDEDNEARLLDMYRLVDSFTSDRDDQAIELLIERLYEMSRVQPEPYRWLNSLVDAYNIDAATTVDDLVFIEDIKKSIRLELQSAWRYLEEMRDITLLPDGPAAYGTTLERDFDDVRTVLAISEMGSWQALHDAVTGFKWTTLARMKKDECDPTLQKRAKDKRDKAKKIIDTLQKTYFARQPHTLVEEIRRMAPIIATLVELTKDYSERYKQLKRKRALVDFSDLEHYALQILTTIEDGELVPSVVAQDYQQKFKEVLVDEYQDTNLLQETILQLVKSGDAHNGNMFMVGDLKQSIYRFRLAEPRLFLGKYEQYADKQDGLKIDLNANFRSRREILEGTNYIFTQIMGKQVGELEYDEAASLKYSGGYDDVPTAIPIQVAVIANAEEEDELPEEDDFTAAQYEARYIIREIQQLKESGAMVKGKDGNMRPLEYRDIVILMRSMTWSAEFAEAFKEAEIPLYADLGKGYFEALEVMIMLNTLKVVDNPYQDIALASVLRAPFVGLTENELATIRVSDKRLPFYEALHHFVRQGQSGISTAAAEKLQRFLQLLQKWRNASKRIALSDLVWMIYEDTYYYEMVGAMVNGKQRQANLRILHDRALAYEQTIFRGLFRFLRFVDRMKSRGDDLGTARSVSEEEDVVRVMTIHASKGLEFPVVFVAGLGRGFNKMDFNHPYVFDQQYGLGVKAIDPEHRVTYTSLPFLAIKEKKLLEMRAEEMRILYVAMTRPKERLYLVGSVKDATKSLQDWQESQRLKEHERLPNALRAKANRYLDWIGPAIVCHPDFIEMEQQASYTPSQWNVHFISNDALREGKDKLTQEQLADTATLDATLVEEVTRRFTAQYHYTDMTTKRSKTSVTELKRLQQLQLQEEPELFAQATQTLVKEAPRPAFLQQQSLTAAEVGTAFHAAMHHVPQQGFTSDTAIDAFIDSLVTREILTKDEAAVLERAHFQQFFASAIGQRFMKAHRIWRELPFTMLVKEDTMIDGQIIQGIIDCVIEEQDGTIILLDYKTDRIAKAQLQEELEKRYTIQLHTYAQAIEQILRVPVTEKIIYAVRSAMTIALP